MNRVLAKLFAQITAYLVVIKQNLTFRLFSVLYCHLQFFKLPISKTVFCLPNWIEKLECHYFISVDVSSSNSSQLLKGQYQLESQTGHNKCSHVP